MKSIIFALCLTCTIASFGQAGVLDPSFNNSGYVLTNYFINAKKMALQPDGKIVVVGSSFGIKLLRYTANGALDASFGSSGLVTTPLSGELEIANIIVQQDNKIVVGCVWRDNVVWHQRLMLVRYDTNGTLDNTFGANGIAYGDSVTWASGGCNEPNANNFYFDEGGFVKQQPDGRLVQVGTRAPYCTNQDANYIYAIRYNADGTWDTAFHYSPPGLGPFQKGPVTDLNLLVDGRILIAGYGFGLGADSAKNVPKIWLMPNDGFNPFLNDGAIFKVGNAQIQSFENPLVRTYGGSYIVGGTIDNGTTTQIAIAKLDSPYADFVFARIDSSFASNGVAIPNVGLYAELTGMEVQPDGKIIVSGFADNGLTYSDFIVLRLNANGSLDPTFGNNGIQKTDFTSQLDYAYDMLLQPDGKILVSGQVQDISNPRTVIARYSNDAGVGIVEQIPQYNLRVYPNPLTGIVTVESNAQDSELMLCNALGQTVAKMELVNGKSRFNTSELPNGVYTLHNPSIGQILKLTK